MHNAKFTDKEISNPTSKPRMILVKKKNREVFVLTLFIHVMSDSKFSVLIYIFT